MKKTLGVLLIVAVVAAAAVVWMNTKKPTAEEVSLIEHGKYLVQIAGCNDCHTEGYALKAGKVDEKEWLAGDVLGWQGPWGTTYAINLRQYMQSITEEQWLQIVQKMQSRPPMPYYELQHMSERDLRAIYQFIHSMGPAGKPAPPYLPPGVDAATAVMRLVPPPG